MNSFNYYQPTEILFGKGRLKEAGKVASKFGCRCLLVTVPAFQEIEPALQLIKSVLKENGIEVVHFDKVIPNPTTEVVSAGAKLARETKVEFVIGLGGGSSIDTAKAIAVEATHQGSCWDYLYFRQTQPTERTLPIIAIPTTSGTGSNVTAVAVVTNPLERSKSALSSPRLFPQVSIVDPELMLTLPPYMTAVTGFDAFSHAFESYITPKCSPYTEILALESIKVIFRYLDAAVRDGQDLEARGKMAWADTLAGLCIANSAVTLPHGIAMALSGMYPQVAHGQALASIYLPIMRFSLKYAIEKFATIARLLNPAAAAINDKEAARKFLDQLEEFIESLGIRKSLKEIGVIKSELPLLAKTSLVLPDYTNHPYIVSISEVEELLNESYEL
ncbi:MAG TPA: iron-containing alcohol dehydrogenase [Candidatus Saccharicenans sp.]|nr:iron-containing alcohol dehydrogenase [Candidatus Saccharicenans sp.]